MTKFEIMIPLLIGDKTVGRTTLNKLVFFADVIHFLLHGRSVSGIPHLKLTHGPVPQGVTEVRYGLMRSGWLAESMKEDRFYRQFSYTVPSGAGLADLRAKLEPSELDAIDAVRKKLASKTASFLSQSSHRFEPWKSSKPGHEMDLALTREDESLKRWLIQYDLLPH